MSNVDRMWNVPDELNPREYTFVVALDNYEPTRNLAYGFMVAYDYDNGKTTTAFKIEEHHFGNTPEKCNYLLDFGTHVVPTYVVGWDQRTLILHPMPTNYEKVNFSNWMLGPRKTYHIKVRNSYE